MASAKALVNLLTAILAILSQKLTAATSHQG